MPLRFVPDHLIVDLHVTRAELDRVVRVTDALTELDQGIRLVEAGYLEQVLQACSTTEWAGQASPADVATYRALALSNVLTNFGDRMQMIERDHLNALYLAMKG